MSDLVLAISAESLQQSPPAVSQVPMASEADFYLDNYYRTLGTLQTWEAESLVYQNAATCPDCAGAMIRQGRCCVCPSCGFESCLV